MGGVHLSLSNLIILSIILKYTQYSLIVLVFCLSFYNIPGLLFQQLLNISVKKLHASGYSKCLNNLKCSFN